MTNASYKSPSATRQVDRLCAEASKLCEVVLVDNNYTELAAIGYNKSDIIIFLDKDIYKATQFKNEGIAIFNSANSIALCDDKAMTQMALSQENNIRMPLTIIAPKLYFGCPNIEFLQTITSKIAFPIVVKECNGSLGKQVYLAEDFDKLRDIATAIGTKPHLYQEMVAESVGRSLRIYVVGGKVVASGRLTSTDDFRSNAENGGKMECCELSQKMNDAVIAIANKLGLTFGGIDMFDTEEPIFIEANSNAYFAELEKCTGVNIAREIVKYVLEKGGICQR